VASIEARAIMPPINRPLPGKRVAAVRMPPTAKVRVPPAAKRSQPRMTKKQWAVVGVAILIVGAGAVWASGILRNPDARLAEIKEMWAKVKDVPENERWEKRREIARMQSELPPAEQRKLAEESMARRLNALLSLPPDKRTAEIDKQLDGIVAMQKMFAGTQNAGGAGGGQGGAQQGPQMAGGGGGGQPNAFRNSMLSRIPASSKAAWTQWGQLVQVRAQQRGITMPNWGR
jgi:hypothetical protein